MGTRRSLSPVRYLLACLVGLTIGVGLDVVRDGGPALWLVRQGLAPAVGPPAYALEGRLVDVGGRRLYLDCRGGGSPVVVFEAGYGSDAAGWGTVFPEVARLTRACAYDRANRGRSDPRGRHAASEAADDLARLLARAGERPPYVLVGHSLGGVYVRVFADRHRPDVAGLVLVDPFLPEIVRRLIDATAGLPQADAWRAQLEQNIRLVEAGERLDWAASETELVRARTDGLPVEFVAPPFGPGPLPPDREAIVRRIWRDGLAAISSDLRVTEALDSGHLVHLDRPDLVVAAISRLVDRARSEP
jgi:pimeloyl-ACP methyl ester carboxylesterase